MARVFKQIKTKTYIIRYKEKDRNTFWEIHRQRPKGASWSRHHQVCLQAVRTAAASSPSGWSGRVLCSRSQPQQSSWASQNVPCRSSMSPCAGWPAIPTCWCQRVPCQCTWTADAPADCGCCICPSSLARWWFFQLWNGQQGNKKIKKWRSERDIRLWHQKLFKSTIKMIKHTLLILGIYFLKC